MNALGVYCRAKIEFPLGKQEMKNHIVCGRFLAGLVGLLGINSAVAADDADLKAAEIARKLQDPLANIKAVMTDNDFLFNTGKDDDTSFTSLVQGLYAVSLDDAGLNLVNRAILPVQSMAPEAAKPPVNDAPIESSGRVNGIGDTTLQMFISPKTEEKWKWGIGPQVSVKTRSDSDLQSAGWGGGIAAVAVGDVTEDISTAWVLGHVWGEDGYSMTTFQPFIYYNFPNAPGWDIGYNGTITYNHNAQSGQDRWSVPLGASLGRTWAYRSGLGFQLAGGYYYDAGKPKGAARNTIRFSLNWLLP